MSEKYTIFESSIKKLEDVVKNIENKNMTIDEILSQFREGTLAAKRCIEILKNAEGEVKIISDEIDDMLEESVNYDRNNIE